MNVLAVRQYFEFVQYQKLYEIENITVPAFTSIPGLVGEPSTLYLMTGCKY